MYGSFQHWNLEFPAAGWLTAVFRIGGRSGEIVEQQPMYVQLSHLRVRRNQLADILNLTGEDEDYNQGLCLFSFPVLNSSTIVFAGCCHRN